MKTVWAWLGHHKTVQLLQLAGILRSLCQGIAVVNLSLYLKELGWTGGAIGALFAGTGLVRAVLTSFAGELNALLGPKRFMLLFEIMTAVSALILTVTSSSIALSAAVAAAGFGWGHTGSGGPVTPIERAWLSSYARRNANSIFGTQALLCYLGMGLGAVISSLPPLWRHLLPGAFGYRPLFALIFLFTAGSVCVIAKIAGGKRKTPQVKADAHTDPGKIKDSAPAQAAKSPQGKLPALLVVAALVLGAAIPLWNRLLPVVSLYIPVLVFVLFISAAVFRITGGKPKALLMNDANDVMPPSSPEMTKLAMEKQQELLNLINMVNAIAVTLSSTMTSYWLSAKFGVSSGMIGLVMAASYMLTGVFSLVSIHAAKRFGSVKTIVCMQLAGIVFVLALPWSPWFWLTAVLNIGCIAFNLGTRGNRSVVMVETIRRRKRSWPSRAASLLLRTGTVLWPGVFGKLIEEGQFMLPLYIAGFLQFGSTLWYGKTHQIPRSAAPATGRTEEFRNQKR